MSVIGIDIGATKTAIARYDASSWKQEAVISIPTNASDGFGAVLDRVIGAAEGLRTSDVTTVGVGIPGLLLQPEGQIVRTPNIRGGEGVRLKDILTKTFKLPVAVDNDANCFTLAETTMGAGKGQPVVVGVAMGTGVGGGIVIDGKIFHGASGHAGEIGHMLLLPGHPPFETDDKRGDVEQFLAGTSFGKRCAAAKSPVDYLEGEVCEFLRPEVFREVAWLVTNLTHLLNPSIVIFGGSAGRALKPHLEAIEKELGLWLLPGTPQPRLAIAEREDAGTLGAALLTQ